MPKLIHFFKSNSSLAQKLLAIIAVIAAITLVSNSSFISSVYAQERVYTYSSVIKVLANRSLDVTETITVFVENVKIRHGIYRDFETTRVNQDNKKVNVDLKVISVERNGVSEQFHTRRQGAKIRVFFGSKNKLVNKGIQTYIIRYVTSNQLNTYKNKDEFYWNASGNKWSMPIFRVEATVILPSRVKRKTITFNAYSGYTGVNKQDYISSFTNNHTIKFALNRKYLSGNGLTIAIAWPSGFIEPGKPAITDIPEKLEIPAATPENSTITSIKDFFTEPTVTKSIADPQENQLLNTVKVAVSELTLKLNNPVLINTEKNPIMEGFTKYSSEIYSKLNKNNLIAITGIFLLLMYFLFTRLILSDKKSSNNITNSNDSIPDNLSPASIRYIYETGYDDRTFAIALINIAVKGHIDIINSGNSYKIERRDFSAAEELSRDEKLLINSLMGSESVIQLTSQNHKVIRDAMTKHQGILERDHKNKYFATNSNWFKIGVAFLTSTVIAIAYLEKSPKEMVITFSIISLFTLFTFILSYIFLDLLNFYNTFKLTIITDSILYKSAQKSKEAYIFAIFAIASGLILVLMNYIDTITIVTMLAAGFICAIFSDSFVQPNSEGKKILNKIVNLKEFITHGDMLQTNTSYDSIQISQKISEFDNYLPYTIALGVESEWGDHYSLLFDHKGDDEISGYSPHWYHGSGWQENNTTVFCKSLSSNFSISAASAAKSPEYSFDANLTGLKH